MNNENYNYDKIETFNIILTESIKKRLVLHIILNSNYFKSHKN